MQAAALFFSSESASTPSVAPSAVETVPFAQVFAQAQQVQQTQQVQQQTQPQQTERQTPVSEDLAAAPAEEASAETGAEISVDALEVPTVFAAEDLKVPVVTEFEEGSPELQIDDASLWSSFAVSTVNPESSAKNESAPVFHSLKEWQTFLFRQQELPAETQPVTDGTESATESEAAQAVFGAVEVPAEVKIQAVAQAFIQGVRDFSWGAQGLSLVFSQGASDAMPQQAISVSPAAEMPLSLYGKPMDTPLVSVPAHQASGTAVDALELQTLSLDPAVEANPAPAQTQTAATAAARTPLIPLALPQAARELDKRFQVFRQVEERLVLLRQQHQRELQLQLEPAQLGKLKLRLQQEGALFHLQIVAETPMVKELLDAQMQQLRQQFAAQGFTLDRVDVDVQGQMGDGSPSQDSREAYVPVLMPVPAASFSLFEAAAEPLPHLTYGSAVTGFYYHQVNYLA